jgi:hypothetical protein
LGIFDDTVISIGPIIGHTLGVITVFIGTVIQAIRGLTTLGRRVLALKATTFAGTTSKQENHS